jgi:hypothetical protein
MAHYSFTSPRKFEPRKGLEGPFYYSSGRVLYYDPKQGEYYDPLTDFYVSHEEVLELQQQDFKVLAR